MSEQKAFRRYAPELKAQVLEIWEAGHLSRKQIAEQLGVSYDMVRYWISEREKGQPQQTGFVRVKTKAITTGPRLTITHNFVMHFDGCDAQFVADIARALAC